MLNTVIKVKKYQYQHDLLLWLVVVLTRELFEFQGVGRSLRSKVLELKEVQNFNEITNEPPQVQVQAGVELEIGAGYSKICSGSQSGQPIVPKTAIFTI